MKNSVVIIRMSNKIRMFLYNWLSIFHSNTKSGIFNHRNIIEAVTTAYHRVGGQTDTVEQFLQRVRLVDFLWHNL